MPSFKQTFWKIWYQYLSGRIGSDPVTFLNYGYWPPEGETIELKPQDEPNRPAIQLYHHVASGWDLNDKDVLEVSCGHGGGASFVKCYHQPNTYTAIDQNPKAIEYDRKTHGALGIDFRVGDAQALDFPEGNFDAVINVEASHCYPRQDAFFKSVYRVLRKGGRLLYADFRTPATADQLDRDITNAGFNIESKTDITSFVLSALKRTSQRYRDLVHGLTPAILHPLMETFAAVEGSGVYNSFVNRERIYYSYRLVKAEN
ncbi:MAG TPA: class I SAM-dependent methyltransferase [Anaerolineales bacterium]|nr:class I SAM-dependent methyltransferase [Anaerolineales bacterium]